jgi:hypothetical protein
MELMAEPLLKPMVDMKATLQGYLEKATETIEGSRVHHLELGEVLSCTKPVPVARPLGDSGGILRIDFPRIHRDSPEFHCPCEF